METGKCSRARLEKWKRLQNRNTEEIPRSEAAVLSGQNMYLDNNLMISIVTPLEWTVYLITKFQ
jgi:hypothetical protein